jgi:hypothetical protein
MQVIFEKVAFVHPLKASVESFLNNSKTAKAPAMTFAEIRAALAKDEKDLPDGVIHQIGLDLGLEVIPG